VFPDHQIEKERGVILEEMAMYHDSPDDSIQDEFDSIVYRDHPMGMNILGKPETVNSFQQKDFFNFFREHLGTDKITFSCVGDIPVGEVERVARKYLEGIRRKKALSRRKKFRLYKPREHELRRTVKQAKCAIGRDAYPVTS